MNCDSAQKFVQSAEDVYFTSAQFSAEAGSLFNAQNYSLRIDLDNDGTAETIVQSNVAPVDVSLSFDDFNGGGITIPSDDSVIFEVHGDITSSLATSELQLRFDTASLNYVTAEQADSGDPLEGIETNGNCPVSTCDISVTTIPSILYRLVNQGNLFVTQSTTSVLSRQLLGGALGDPVLRLAFRAEWEPIDVTDMVFTDTSGTIRPSIDRLQLFLPGETLPFASATIDGCQGHPETPSNAYCVNMESNQLVVFDDEMQEVLVRPLLISDEFGAVSAELIQLELRGDMAVLARGFTSSNRLAVNDGDTTAEGEVFIGTALPNPNAPITGNPNDVVLAKIITIEDVNPDPDGTSVPVGTNKRIAEFKFTAAANENTLNGRNRATLSGITFNIASTNVTFTAANFDLFNKNDQTQKIDCTTNTTATASGSFFVECKRVVNSAVDLEISSGEAVTLVLEADIITNQVDSTRGSFLVVSLANFSDRTKTVFAKTATDSHVQWSDSLTDTTVSVFRWIENDNVEIPSTTYDL